MKDIQRDVAFEDAFQLLYPRAAEAAGRLLGDAGAAEDVAAEAMARAFAEWDSIQHLAHRDAWVLRVTTDLAFDASRRRPHFPRPKAARNDHKATALAAALRSLPRRQREVVALRHAATLTDEEIARSLEIPPATVVARMDRGMAALRKQARDPGESP